MNLEISARHVAWVPKGDLEWLRVLDISGRQLVYLDQPSRELALAALWDALITWADKRPRDGFDFLRIEAKERFT